MAPPLQKHNSYTQAIEDLLRWSPIRWWGSGEINPEERDRYADHPALLGESVGSRQPLGYQATLPGGPKDRTIARYIANQEEQSRGQIFLSGPVLFVNGPEEIIEVNLTVHANAFSIERMLPRTGDIDETKPKAETLAAYSFSPFSIVSPAQLAGYQGPIGQNWSPFKLTVVRAEGDRQYVFIVHGKNAEDERHEWIKELAAGIMRVTASLFPPYSMEVRPLPAIPGTATRLMAGYLLRCETSDSVAMLYAELHAYFGGEAKVVLYKDEWCDQKVSLLTLTQHMDVHSCKGVDCSIFALDGHLYSARTQEERLIWLRALGNTKVKLLYTAPDPTREEIAGFRAAILERALDLKQIQVSKPRVMPMLPLLPPRPRMAPKSLRGDDLTMPEPNDDEMSGTQSRTNSRVVESADVAEEDAGTYRLARVVELMDETDCREFLKPFGTNVDLDNLEANMEASQVDLDSLEASPESIDLDSVEACEKARPSIEAAIFPGLRSPAPAASVGPESPKEITEGPSSSAAPSPPLGPLAVPTTSIQSFQSRGQRKPESSSSIDLSMFTQCVPERADLCRRRCVREGVAATAHSYPDLFTKSRELDNGAALA